MTNQRAYGDESSDTALVPGTLTAYRHFRLNPSSRQLSPMRSYLMAGTSAYPPGPDVFVADCRASLRHLPNELPPDHETPSVDCTCGFYAHYSPDTDFYPHSSWQSYYDCTNMPCFVRAVVELSGRVVMGTLGVRAAKLKVKALAIDWAKHDELEPGDSMFRSILDGTRWFRRPTATPGPEIKALYEGVLSDACAAYGAEAYADPAVMYEAWPEPDLDSLGIKKAEPQPRLSLVQGLRSGKTTTTLQSYAQVFSYREAADAAAKALGDIIEHLKVSGFPLDDGPEMTPFEAAIEAKKRRPAPPGTGIDRRKRKL